MIKKILKNSVPQHWWRYLYGRIQNIGMGIEAEQAHRQWSNRELMRYGHLFTGDIVNISGWKDEDRGGQGLHYSDYFPNKSTYTITNYPGTRGTEDSSTNFIPLDLEIPPPADLMSRWDVVFCHTTLEHIFDIHMAVKVLSDLTRDICIIVVPFIQNEHYDVGAYGDYWRFTPMCLDKMFSLHGLETVYVSANDQPYYPIYLFYICSKDSKKWDGKFPSNDTLNKKLGESYYSW